MIIGRMHYMSGKEPPPEIDLHHGDPVKIGDVFLGGGHPVAIQSMTNTATSNVGATVGQAMRLFDAGAHMVRIAVADRASADVLPEIRKKLASAGYRKPLIGDIHFRPELAMTAARHLDKVRINPGNFSGSSPADKALAALVKVCRDHGTAIRIGTNTGSLPANIVQQYGRSPEGMVEATTTFLRKLEDLGFFQTVISLKASHPHDMVRACMLMQEKMKQSGRIYPLHIGLTEAGSGIAGRIRSAVGIGTLLKMGIGATIRVSLTENPENEIPVARMITEFVRAAIEPAPGKTTGERLHYEAGCPQEVAIRAAIDIGDRLLLGKTKHFTLQAPGLKDQMVVEEIRQLLLQAAGLPNTLTEFIACPACGRAAMDVEQLLEEVKRTAGSLPGIKIAVMGCVVNGPGEMAGAHYGLMGAGKDNIWLYKDGEVVGKNIPQKKAAKELVRLLRADKRLPAEYG